DGNLTDEIETDASGNVLDSFTYGINGEEQIINTYSPAGGFVQYGYDAAGQLTGATYAATPWANESYSYDPAGNRETTTTGTAATDTLQTTTSTTTTGNQLQSDGTFIYSYDADGNVVQKERISEAEAPDFKTVYSYDNAGRLVEATTEDNTDTITQNIVYSYNVEGQRVGETLTVGGTSTVTKFAYDLDGNVAATFTGNNVLTGTYVYGQAVDQLLAQEDGSGNVNWMITDRDQSVRDVVQYNGTTSVVDHIDYNSFGVTIDESNPSAAHIDGYAGYVNDLALGMLETQSRIYNPSTGEFISQDPTGFSGSADGNLYEYAGNSPIDMVDPSGMSQADPTSSLNFSTPLSSLIANDANGDGIDDNTGQPVGSTSSLLVGAGGGQSALTFNSSLNFGSIPMGAAELSPQPWDPNSVSILSGPTFSTSAPLPLINTSVAPSQELSSFDPSSSPLNNLDIDFSQPSIQYGALPTGLSNPFPSPTLDVPGELQDALANIPVYTPPNVFAPSNTLSFSPWTNQLGSSSALFNPNTMQFAANFADSINQLWGDLAPSDRPSPSQMIAGQRADLALLQQPYTPMSMPYSPFLDPFNPIGASTSYMLDRTNAALQTTLMIGAGGYMAAGAVVAAPAVGAGMSYAGSYVSANLSVGGVGWLGQSLAVSAQTTVAQMGPTAYLSSTVGLGALGYGLSGGDTETTKAFMSAPTFALGLAYSNGYSYYQSPLTVSAPTGPQTASGTLIVNLGGEGEVPGAINQNLKSILDPTWLSSRGAGNLAQLQQQGAQFVISSNAQLPFATNSVPGVITNSVPVNINNYLGPGIQSSEVQRILAPGSTWIHNGVIQYYKIQ
ncbi:MAG TPA: RHS repeat-associated core domain-containing protein, partial [Pirellulales bacterium]|nr:RHS repeat-associated core domain-containing protein [Pirellulales bacterium]